jgi:hypothetical protein
MGSIYAVGGRQRRGVVDDTDVASRYGAGLIVSVDLETGQLEGCVEYVSPPEVRADTDSPSILFESATLVGDRMYVPTTTEVLVYSVPDFTRRRYVTLPCFNDVHHVRPGDDGSLLVANTGLDMVVEIGPDDQIIREWSVLGEGSLASSPAGVDYRRVASTKPHMVHPNHVFILNGDIWVTRCNTRDMLCLTGDSDPIRIAENAPIHDGLVVGDSVYFTVVQGEVVVVDGNELRVRDRYDLNAMAGRDTSLGWCRGIEVLGDDLILVAFSRIRPTKWKQNVRWIKSRLGGSGVGLYPTGLMLFDLKKERLIWEADLEPVGMGTIFSIHSVE